MMNEDKPTKHVLVIDQRMKDLLDDEANWGIMLGCQPAGLGKFQIAVDEDVFEVVKSRQYKGEDDSDTLRRILAESLTKH